MRRTIAAVAMAFTLVLATVLAAAATATPTATFEWPPGPVEMNGAATVTVYGHDLTEPTRVYLFKKANYPDGVFEDFEFLDPTDPTTPVVMNLDTTQPATIDYILVVGGVEGDPAFIARSDYTLTVTGIVSTLTATIPTGPFTSGDHATITGHVTGEAGREVLIQHQGDNGTWVTLGSTHTDSAKNFTTDLPTWWVATLHLRAYAPATATAGPVATETTTDVTINRAYTPRPGTAFSYLDYQTRPRWNPCAPVTYRINPNGMPRDGKRQVARALTQITNATGLRFTYAGKTTFVPLAKTNTPGAVARKTDIAIAWATPKQVRALKRATGRGGATQRLLSENQGELTHGWAVLKKDLKLAPTKAANKKALAKVLLHNLTHAVGLGNTEDPQEIMNEKSRVSARFAAGDLAGLTQVGASKGCL